MKGELIIIDGKNYDQYSINTGNQIATILEYIPTEEELLQKINEKRIDELRKIIYDKKLLDLDYQSEKDELQGLLGL